jgi:hypothetical protein
MAKRILSMVVPCLLVTLAATDAQADQPQEPPPQEPPPQQPPPSQPQQQPPAPQQAEDPRMRFGIFAGGLAFPGLPATALAGGGTIVLPRLAGTFETRVIGLVYFVEDDFTKTTGGAALAQVTRWFGAYGIGLGSGLGYASFENKGGGWDGTSVQIIAYLAPVMLRLGEKRNFELALNAGVTRFFSQSSTPFGYASAGVMF